MHSRVSARRSPASGKLGLVLRPDKPENQFASLDIGRRFRIRAPHVPAAGDGRIELVMSRGAFGSGEHETTASCLELLETLDGIADAEVLDLGSGTGVLALAALCLGATRATCVDVSAEAVAVARENGRLNGLDARLDHVLGTLEAVGERDFDLILANLYGDLLIDLAADVVARARPGARILLSGMLWEYNFEARRSFTRLGCRELSNRMLTEFSTALLVAP